MVQVAMMIEVQVDMTTEDQVAMTIEEMTDEGMMIVDQVDTMTEAQIDMMTETAMTVTSMMVLAETMIEGTGEMTTVAMVTGVDTVVTGTTDVAEVDTGDGMTDTVVIEIGMEGDGMVVDGIDMGIEIEDSVLGFVEIGMIGKEVVTGNEVADSAETAGLTEDQTEMTGQSIVSKTTFLETYSIIKKKLVCKYVWNKKTTFFLKQWPYQKRKQSYVMRNEIFGTKVLSLKGIICFNLLGWFLLISLLA